MEKLQQTVPVVKAERAEQLQFLRFLAFLNIYIAHAEVYLFFDYPASHCAASAVSFFFMLSGLVTGLSLYGREIRLDWKSQGMYMWKKLRKVYPMYFLTTAFCFLFYRLPNIVAAGDWAALAAQGKTVLANLLMVQTWLGIESLNGVAWFLATLIFLYPLSLPGMWVLNKVGKRRFPVLWLGGLFGLLMVVVTVYCRLTWPYNMEYLQYSLPAARAFEFLMGMVLGYGVRHVKPFLDRHPLNGFLATVLEAAALCFWVFSLNRAGNYWMNRIVSWLIPNTVLLAVFTVGRGWISGLFRKKPLVRLGDISFNCFLIHNILVVRYVLSVPHMPQTLVGKAVPFLTCLLLTVLISLQLSPKQK